MATGPTLCPKCGARLDTPIVCGGCGTLFAVPVGTDAFDLLGLPRTFALDETKLRSAFRSTARRIHPDRFADESSRALAVRLSAELNHAYHVLSDPVRRCDYLLDQSGGPTAADCRDVPGELLAEVMMLREELEDARAAGDQPAIERQRAVIAGRREDARKQIAERAERLETCNADERMELRRLLNSMTYFDNLSAELAGDPLAAKRHA